MAAAAVRRHDRCSSVAVVLFVRRRGVDSETGRRGGDMMLVTYVAAAVPDAVVY